jgi:aryl-alcohol dehydrogenase-like predicted oxidoreductase
MKQKQTTPVLGSALWGWSVDTDCAYSLLAAFYEQGGRCIDTASNYPINKNPGDFHRAEEILSAWIKAHGVRDLKIISKIGSLNNLGTSQCNLKPSFLLIVHDRALKLFGTNHACLMVHWDNRSEQAEVDETVEMLLTLAPQVDEIGLSGLAHPELYAKYFDSPLIEIKYNPANANGPKHYSTFKEPRFLAYGVTMGGLKVGGSYDATSSATLRGVDTNRDLGGYAKFLDKHKKHHCAPKTLHHVGLLFAHNTPNVHGIILGASKVEQLRDSLSYLSLLNENDTQTIFRALSNS